MIFDFLRLKFWWGHSVSCSSCRRSTSKPCSTLLSFYCPFPKLFMSLSSKQEQDSCLVERRLEGEGPYSSATFISSLAHCFADSKMQGLTMQASLTSTRNEYESTAQHCRVTSSSGQGNNTNYPFHNCRYCSSNPNTKYHVTEQHSLKTPQQMILQFQVLSQTEKNCPKRS